MDVSVDAAQSTLEVKVGSVRGVPELDQSGICCGGVSSTRFHLGGLPSSNLLPASDLVELGRPEDPHGRPAMIEVRQWR